MKENLAYEVKTNPERFQKERYQIFRDEYPEIDIRLLTMTNQASTYQGTTVLPVWKI